MADKAKPVKGHYITLGDGRRVTLGQYVDAWKKTKATDPDAWVRGAPNADHRAETYRAREALQQFRAGMDDRINAKDPRFGKGRKWDSQWQADARRLSDTLQRRSEIRPGEAHPVDLRPRIAHRVEGGVPAATPGGTKRYTAPAVVERNLDRIERLGYERFREAARSLGVSVEGGNTQIRENIRRYVANGFGEGGRILSSTANAYEQQAKTAARAELRSLVDKTSAPQSVKDRAVKAGMAEHDRVDRALMKKSRPTPQVPAMKGMTPMGAKTAESAKKARGVGDAGRMIIGEAEGHMMQVSRETEGKVKFDGRRVDTVEKAKAYLKARGLPATLAAIKAKERAPKSPATMPSSMATVPPRDPAVAAAKRAEGEARRAAIIEAERAADARMVKSTKAKRTVSIMGDNKYLTPPGARGLTNAQKDAMVVKGGPAPDFKSPKADAPVKVADAVPHKGTKIPAPPKGLTPKQQAAAAYKEAFGRAPPPRMTAKAMRDVVVNTKARIKQQDAMMDRLLVGDRPVETASKRSPSKTSTSAPAAPHAAEKAVRATQAKEAAVVNRQMTEPKAPTAAAETAKPARLTPYQQSLQAPPRQLSHARDHTGKLDPLYTSKSRSQLVEEGVKKGIGTRSELRALQPEALAKRLKYRGLAGLAVAVVAGGAAALMTRSSTAAAAPADSGKTRTDPYTDSMGRQYKNGRLIVRQQ